MEDTYAYRNYAHLVKDLCINDRGLSLGAFCETAQVPSLQAIVTSTDRGYSLNMGLSKTVLLSTELWV